MKPASITLRTCRPDTVDGRQVFEWRSDPLTQEMFFTRLTLDWEAFFPIWRDGYFSDPSLPPVFAEDEHGTLCAIMSFKRVAGLGDGKSYVDISINVAPSHRGLGIGASALKLAADYLRHRHVDCVLAVVKTSNAASNTAFLKAGFLWLDEQMHLIESTGEQVPVNRYILNIPKP